MSGQFPRQLNAEEQIAVRFFEKHVGGATRHLKSLNAQCREVIQEAGERWQECGETLRALTAIQAEIDDAVEYMVYKYTDWATD